MKRILLLFSVVFLVGACSKIKKVDNSSLKTYVSEPLKEQKSFQSALKNFYNLFFNESSDKVLDYLNKEIIVANKLGANYNLQIVNSADALNLVYYPGEKIDTFIEDKFPKIDPQTGQWTKQGIFIQKYNKSELEQLKQLSPQPIDNQKFDNLSQKISFKVLDTYYNTITYWGKTSDGWKIFAIEILE